MKQLHGMPDMNIIIGQHALRDFHVDHILRNFMRQYNLIDLIQDVTQIKIKARQIEGNRHKSMSLIHFPPIILTYQTDNMQIKLMDQQIFFQNMNKQRRRHQAVYRILPAGKGFHSAQLAGQGTHHRLIIDMNPSVPDGLIKILQDICTAFHRKCQLPVIVMPENISHRFPAEAVGRCLRLVPGSNDRIRRRDVVDSSPDT